MSGGETPLTTKNSISGENNREKKDFFLSTDSLADKSEIARDHFHSLPYL